MTLIFECFTATKIEIAKLDKRGVQISSKGFPNINERGGEGVYYAPKSNAKVSFTFQYLNQAQTRPKQ